MNDDLINNRKAKFEYLQTWQSNFRQAQEMVPYVKREIDMTKWQIDALSNSPNEGSDIPTGDMFALFKHDLKIVNEILPMMPKYDLSLTPISGSFTTAGTTCVYQYVSRFEDINTKEAQEFSTNYTEKYQKMQLEHNRPDEIRGLLARFPTNSTLERFNEAEKCYMQFKTGVIKKSATAGAMRTFLDGLKGDLLQKAKRHENENTPTWEKMAERLSRNGSSGIEYNQMISEKTKHTDLKTRLSNIFKNREGESIYNIDHTWTELLDHIYIILNIINL